MSSSLAFAHMGFIDKKKKKKKKKRRFHSIAIQHSEVLF